MIEQIPARIKNVELWMEYHDMPIDARSNLPVEGMDITRVPGGVLYTLYTRQGERDEIRMAQFQFVPFT